MLVIANRRTNAYFNLAAEEYLLKYKSESVAMIWQNERAVIIGRSQTARTEIDFDYVSAKNIRVVRRLTGGGAVYHDLGNVNYTFILRGAAGDFEDYRTFAQPIVYYLTALGIPAYCAGKNDILAGERKISGTAKVTHNGDILFHGTLLVDTDFTELAGALKPDYTKLARHGIKSVAARVANLREFDGTLTAARVFEGLIAEFSKGGEAYDFTPGDIREIERLAEEKYSQDSWNFDDIDYEE